MVKGMKALQKFADRAPYQTFFCQVEEIYGDQLQIDRQLKAKKQERERRIAAGEAVSDTSSQKEAKRIAKQELIEKIRRESTVAADDRAARSHPPPKQKRRQMLKVQTTVVVEDDP